MLYEQAWWFHDDKQEWHTDWWVPDELLSGISGVDLGSI